MAKRSISVVDGGMPPENFPPHLMPPPATDPAAFGLGKLHRQVELGVDTGQGGAGSEETLESLGWLDAPTASRLLGVTRETLYTYVSRRLIRSAPSPTRANQSIYVRADVERLLRRRDQKSGAAPAGSSALRWGEPVLDSALTSISSDGPAYRGILATDLVDREIPFESVAELLWSGELPAEPPQWSTRSPLPARKIAALLPENARAEDVLQLTVAALAARDATAYGGGPALELARAREVCLHLAASLAWVHAPDAYDEALGAGSIAQVVAVALGAKRTRIAAHAIGKALVLCADHELNVSAFAARIAASAGADLHACIAAGLAALSGPRHGGMSRRVEALLREIGSPDRARPVVQERFRRGDRIPGFGHPLYPERDPRGDALLEVARGIGGGESMRIITALVKTMRDERREPPTIDLGLVALCAALGLPAGSAFALFAVGRVAGWIAHVFEQRADPHVLRPRARYVGPPPAR